MKLILILSLILNVLIGYNLYVEKNRPPLERIIIGEKKVEPKVPKDVHVINHPRPQISVKQISQKEKKHDDDQPHLLDKYDERDFQDDREKMSMAKRNFFEKENIDPLILEKAAKINNDFQRDQAELFKDYFPGEVNIEKRRKQLELEEKYQKDMAKVLGKKTWDNFQILKKRYNESVLKSVSNEDGQISRPFVLMDI